MSDDTSRYGRVRKATIGEVPTHLAMEDMRRDEGLIVHFEDMMRQNLDRRIVPPLMVFVHHHDLPQPEPWMLDEMKRKRRDRVRSKWNMIATFIAFVAFLGILLLAYSALTPQADAQAITIVDAPPAPPTIHAVVTAYTSSVDETDSTPHITASGYRTEPGTIACPAQYAFGTEVKIGDATYTCRDRMSVKFPNRFDVWVMTKAEAYAWGKETVDVEIISTP